MEDDSYKHPGKDHKGRFLPGHTYGHGPKKEAGEPIEVHPEYHWLDKQGRYLPGVSGKAGNRHCPGLVQELKRAMLDAVTPEQIQAAIAEVLRIGLSTEHTTEDKLKALSMFFDRVIGKPTAELYLEKHTTQTKVSMDLSKLSDTELYQLQATLKKATPVIDVPAEVKRIDAQPAE